MAAPSTAKARRIARKSPSKVARGAAANRAAQATRGKPAPVKALKVAGSCALQLGTGWAHADPPTPVANVQVDGGFAHLAVRVKAKDSTPTWDVVAVIPDWHYRPESGRGHLPCAVRDASAGKWYMALGRVSGGGVVSVEMTGASADGSLVTPFAIGAGDEVHMSFAYYNS